MQKYILLLCLIISTTLLGQNKDQKDKTCEYNFTQSMTFEMGLNLGTPVAIDTRFWFTDSIGLTSMVGLDFEKDFALDLGVIFEFFTLYQNDYLALKLDFGLALSMGSYQNKDNDTLFQSSGYLPIGFSMPLKQEAVTFSLYFSPGMIFTPDVKWDYQWGAIFNYNFGRGAKLRKQKRCFLETLAKRNDTINLLDGKLGDSNKKIKGLEGEKEQLGSVIKSLEGEQKILNTKIGSLKEIEKDLNNKINNLNGDIIKLKEDIKDSDNRKQKKLREKIVELEKEKKAVEKAKKEEITRINKENEKKQREIKELQKDIQNLKEAKAKAKAKMEQLNKQRCLATGGTFTDRCHCPAGRVSRDSQCMCPGVNEVWSPISKKCSCRKTYKKKKGVCTKCSLLTYWGNCTSRCPSPQVPWKGRCACPSSKNFIRNRSTGECKCKPGYKELIKGKCILTE